MGYELRPVMCRALLSGKPHEKAISCGEAVMRMIAFLALICLADAGVRQIAA